MVVLRILGLANEPMSINDLLLKMGEGFKERSVRRWLNLLVAEGVIKKVG